MALVPEHGKCAGYFNVKLLFSECIDQGEDPHAEGPIATNVRPFRSSQVKFLLSTQIQNSPPLMPRVLVALAGRIGQRDAEKGACIVFDALNRVSGRGGRTV